MMAPFTKRSRPPVRRARRRDVTAWVVVNGMPPGFPGLRPLPAASTKPPHHHRGVATTTVILPVSPRPEDLPQIPGLRSGGQVGTAHNARDISPTSPATRAAPIGTSGT
jgi:hypothetical protein